MSAGVSSTTSTPVTSTTSTTTGTTTTSVSTGIPTLSNTNTNGLNFNGLASGLDTTKIISGLTSINQKRIDQLKSQQGNLESQQAAFTGIQVRLAGLQLQAGQLARSVGGVFDGRTATASDATVLTATAGTAATPGTYTLSVNNLASSQQLASQGFADPTSQIKTGTLTLKLGAGTATTVTIDNKNNTLQGLADSINNAGSDIKAAIINDGSGTPYRLLLTATKSGSANTISITNNLTGGSGASIDPASTTLQNAADASVTLGSGAGAITITSASNQLTNIIPGVSMNLLKTTATNTPITLTVANDTDSANKAVQSLVTTYNDLVDYVTQQTSFDPSTGTGGLLLGNGDVRSIQNDLFQVFTSSVAGVSTTANRLSSIGITLDDKGKLSLDQSKLTSALNGQSGVALSDVKRLFGLTGTSSDPGVQFIYGGSKTQPSPSGSPYQVNVTTPATRASAVATNALASSITIDNTNNSFAINLNGVSSTSITLTAGSYTQSSLASEIQKQINSNSALSGNGIAVGLDGSNHLTFTSQAYGSASRVSFGGGNALSTLGLSGTESATGTNVAGNFVVNGKVEAATGSGQLLSGVSSNANTAGLQVRITSSTATTANLSVTNGVAGKLNGLLDKYINPTSGRLKNVNDTYNTRIQDIQKTITNQNDVLTQKTAELQQQFADMEAAVSTIKNLQSQLVAIIPKF